MDEMVAWLTGVLDEIEQKAHALPGAPWTLHITDYAYVNSGGEPIATVGGPQSVPIAEHIALHDTRSVLARVEAERAVIADALAIPTAEVIIAELAYGHRFDAPGYQDSWAPDGTEERT